MDISSFGIDNFFTKVIQGRQPVLILCMPRDLDFQSQVKSLARCCESQGGTVIPAVLDENFIGPFQCKYCVKGTPTFLIFDRGEEQGRILGLHNADELTEFIKENLDPHRVVK